MSIFPLGIGKLRVLLAPNQSLLGIASLDDLDWSLDLTGYVRAADGLKIVRGKTDERSTLRTSTLRFTVDDDSGDFDKDNPASPLYGMLLPYTPVKVETDEATPRAVFTGITGDDWLVPREVERDSWVTLECTDAFAILARTPLKCYLPEDTPWGQIKRILRFAGWPEGEWVLYGDEGGSRIRPTILDGQSAMEALILVLQTEGIYRSFLGIDKEGRMAFAGRYAPFAAPFSTILATFGNTPGAVACGKADPGLAGRSIFNQIEVSFLEGTPASTGAQAAIEVASGADTIPLLGITEDPDALLDCDVPAGGTFDFGTGKVVTLAEEAQEGDGGLTIVPIDVAIPASATASWTSNVVIAADNASQLRYGKLKLAFSGLLLTTSAEAKAMAEDALLDYSAPRSRIDSIALSGIRTEEEADWIIDLAVGNRIVFEHQAYYASTPASWELSIHGIETTFLPGDTDCTLRTALAPVDRDFWTLGAEEDDDTTNSLIGETDDDPAGEAILTF